MTNPEQETRKAVAEYTVTKIQGQPTNRDIDRLEDELIAIASSFHSELGGGLHGHAGLVKERRGLRVDCTGHTFYLSCKSGSVSARSHSSSTASATRGRA